MLGPVTRRDLLRSFLGSSIATIGCRGEARPPLPPGELVGASVDFGHRLRNRSRIELSADDWQDHDVVIVGGGIAGLVAARNLLQSGIRDFVLLELEAEIGGTSRAGRTPVTAFPWGAHYVPAPTSANPELIELLQEVGVVEGRDDHGEPVYAEQHLCHDPQERLFYKGNWYEGLYLQAGATEQDLRERLEFEKRIQEWIRWRDSAGNPAFTIPVSSCSRDAMVMQLDDITMLDWFQQQGFQSERLRWWIDYACRDDYGLKIESTSAWAGLFYFTARRPDPDRASQPFLTWPEGNGRIVDHLRSLVTASRIRSGHLVVEVEPGAADGAAPIRIRGIKTSGERAFGFQAKAVILAIPQFLGQAILKPWQSAPPRRLNHGQYGAWAVANLWLKDRPTETGFPTAWDNVLYESQSLGYVVATHQTGPDLGPTIWTWYYPMVDKVAAQGRQRMYELGRDEWAELAMTDLSVAHPDLSRLVERIDVMRWGHAMIQPRPGFLHNWNGHLPAAQQPGITFAHTDMSGLALFEEAFDHGQRAAVQTKAWLNSLR